MNEIREWAARWGLPPAALVDLAETLGAHAIAAQPVDKSETFTQSQVRLAAPSLGMRLWRNNVGALLDKRGVPVRYGLANDSAALNRKLKSGDLIGWRRVLVTLEMVGSTIAQFVSLESKRQGWRFTGDEHEQAQQRWAALVATEGGYARFVTGPEGLA